MSLKIDLSFHVSCDGVSQIFSKLYSLRDVPQSYRAYHYESSGDTAIAFVFCLSNASNFELGQPFVACGQM